MKGYLEKTEDGWVVFYDKRTLQEPCAEYGKLPLHPLDILLDRCENIIFCSFSDDKEVDFEVVKLCDDVDGKEGIYAKLINKVFNTDEDSLNKLAESIYEKGVKEDYEEGFVDGYNKAKGNYEVTSSVRELHQYKLGLNDGYNKAIENTYTKEQTIEISDDEIEKAALDWCLGLDEKGCKNTGDNYDNHELPAFIAACKWYRKKINEIIKSLKLK
jgi:hypothetical protein